jgi:hypothetical protein
MQSKRRNWNRRDKAGTDLACVCCGLCRGYQIDRIVETHVHADHLTGAQVWKKVRPVPLPLSFLRFPFSIFLRLVPTPSSPSRAAHLPLPTTLNWPPCHHRPSNPWSLLRHPPFFVHQRVRPSSSGRRGLPPRIFGVYGEACAGSHAR